jgi:hypothetical protein
MIATYEIKVFRNVGDNHRHDREYTFFIEKFNQNSNNIGDAKNEAVKKAKSLNYDEDFYYCTYNADLESITVKY